MDDTIASVIASTVFSISSILVGKVEIECVPEETAQT